MFYIAGGIYLVGAIFYGIFASAVRQPWAIDKTEDLKKENGAYENKAVEPDQLQV